MSGPERGACARLAPHSVHAAAHPREGPVGFLLVFFASWWAWMKSDPERRVTARRYAVIIGLLRPGWTAMLPAPAWWPVGGRRALWWGRS